MAWMVVLNDGETYSALEGCEFLWVPEKIAQGQEGPPVDEFVKENRGIRITFAHVLAVSLNQGRCRDENGV